jgi:ABC-type glycerol-3-phosphate transport system substrate-binding protein
MLDFFILLARLLVLIVLVLSAACSTGTPDSAQPTPPATAAGQGEAEGEGHVVITFASDEYQRSLYEPLMEEFNRQNPGITVQFVSLPQPEPGEPFEITDWNRMLASAGDTTLMYGLRSMGSGGSVYFRDLGPLIDMDAAFASDDFWPGALDACGDNEGRILGIPLTISLNGIFFDEAAYDAAGLAHPAPGWTWDDFRKSTVALAQKKGNQIRYGYAERGYLYGSVLEPLVGAYLERTGGEVDPQALQAELGWYFDLVESEAITPMRSMQGQQDWQEWEKLFQGETRPAMWPGSLGESLPGGAIMISGDDPFSGMAIKDFGFAPYPVAGDQAGGRTSPASAMCGSISAGSQHPREAWAWLAYISHQWLVRDRNAPWEITQMPSRQSLAEQVDFWKNLPEKAVPAIRFAAEHAWYGTLYSRAFDALNTALTETSGGGDFAAAFAKAQAALASTPEPTSDSAAIVVATPPAPPPSDATVIDYFYDGINNPDAGDFKALVETFNQSHPDLFVKVSGDFGSPTETTDWLAFMAGKYDCFSWYSIGAEQNTDALLSLNSFLDAEGPAFAQDFPPELLDQYRQAGDLFGLPTSSQPQIMAYNADLLAKHGLEPPSNEWTFDDFIQLAAAAASTEGEKSYGFMTSEWDSLLLAGRGAQLYDISPENARIDTPEMLSALTWLGELKQTGMLLVQGQDNWEEINDAITSGRVAFWTTQAGQPDYYFNPFEEPPYQIGAAPMPAIQDAGYGINWAMTRGNFIAHSNQNPQACWTWIKFLSEQPNAYPGVPARLSVADSPAWKAQVGERNAEVYRFALANATPASEMPNPDRTVWPLYTWRSQAVSAVLKGEDPEDALAASQDKAETYLACIQPVETAGMSDEDVQKEVVRCARQADPSGQWQ